MKQASLLYLTLSNARLTKRWLRDTLDQTLQHDSAQIPFELLSHIEAQGNTQQELAQRMHCSKQEVSRLMQKAKRDGWVDIHTDALDKRAKRVKLSERAQQALKQGQTFYAQMEQQLFDGLPEAEKQQLTEAAQLLADRLACVMNSDSGNDN